MKSLFLHIGAPKSATSLLQSFFSRNVSALAEREISYPEFEPLEEAAVGAVTSGNAARLARSMLPENHPAYLRGEQGDAAWRTFMDVLASNARKAILLSSEFFFVVPREGFDRLKQAAQERGYECTIIVYLRRQDKFAQSAYAQLVKRDGLQEPAEAFCARAYKDDPSFSYLGRLRALAGVFGKDKIVVRPFESKQMRGGDIAVDFLDAIGISDHSLFARTKDKVNQSPSAIELEFFRLINVFYPVEKHRDKLLSLTGRVADLYARRQAIIPPKLQFEIAKAFEAENAEIAREFMGRSDGRMFLEPLPDPEAPWTPVRDMPSTGVAAVAADLAIDMDRRITTLSKAVDEIKAELDKLKGSQ